jgi:hypothetical protein
MGTHSRPLSTLIFVLIALLALASSQAQAQMVLEPPRVFGYFQNSLTYVNARSSESDYTSFSMQQLNLMMQQELTPDWTAFINLEFVNSFSTSRFLGDLNLEEAWVRYRISQRLNLKLGLHVPEFNRLNTIKTKMPLLPYIVRPLAYESSLSEVIPTHEYVPEHAYVSLYGTIPVGAVTVDHAVYVGNSPNLSTTLGQGQSAVDTSVTFLTGFRLGVRAEAIQAGVSGSLDFVDYPQEIMTHIRDKSADITEIPRYRFGSDLRLAAGPLTFEGEMIFVRYDDDISETLIDKEFYYGTIMYTVNDRLTIFGGYWYTGQEVIEVPQGFDVGLDRFDASQRIPNFGVAYTVNDRLTAKLHFGKIDEETKSRYRDNDLYDFMHYGLAVSAMF